MSRLPQYDNVLIMRTLSKMGLAGLRLGLLVGHPAWLNEFDKVRLPYNINVLTQVSATFALQHQAVLDEQSAQIRYEREQLLSRLRQFDGIEVFPTQANFILLRTAPGRADAIFDTLKQHKVLIKNLNHAGGLLRDCLRVTVGTPEENAAFLDALRIAMDKS